MCSLTVELQPHLDLARGPLRFPFEVDARMNMVPLLMMLILVVAVLEHGFASVNPGLQIQISKAGLNYGSTVAVDILVSKAKSLKIPDQKGSARTPVGRVKYEITNMQVTGFEKPQAVVTINPGAGLTWQLGNVRLSMTGRWRYKYHFIKDHGTFDITIAARNLLSVSISLASDPSGRPTIASRGCTCNVDSVKIRFHGGASWLYNLFASKVERPVRDTLRRELCNEANKVIDVSARAQLATLPVTIDVLKDWILDYRLVTSPVFKSEFMELQQKGEFFFRNNTKEAPFQAYPFPSATAPNRMITVWISDYTLKTIGYVLHNGGALQRHLSKDQLPPNHRGAFNTTCTSLECFGFLIPSAGKMYPNATAEFDLFATSAPTASISTDGVRGNFFGTISCGARLSNGTLAPMFKANVSSTAAMSVSLRGLVLTGTVTSLSANIKITESQIGELPDQVLTTLFNIAAKIVIIPELNVIAQQGIPIPSMQNVQLVTPRLDTLDHCVRIETDIQYVRSEYLQYGHE